jgi:hypothetical protein
MGEGQACEQKRWSRDEIAGKIETFEREYASHPSQRHWAEELEIPRTTLQHWLERQANLDADPDGVAFFESPAGVAFLHRLVLAAHWVTTLVGPGGIRLVCLFLELSGLDRFVAASYSAQQKVSVALEEAVVEFGQEERERLAGSMEPQQITVCEDETFHPETCLVAIEPASNFILLERYAESRKAEEWTQAMEEATTGLPVEIVQSTSDEGRGLRHHVKEDLGAPHSPDVFPVQQELGKATRGALASRRRQAEKVVAAAAGAGGAVPAKAEAPGPEESASEAPPGREPPREPVSESEREAAKALETAVMQQEQVQQAIRGISTAYHPYDLETGAARGAEEVATALEQHFAAVEQVAVEASLAERCRQKIAKAKRVVVEMVATVAFFFLTVRAKVEALSLAPEVEQALYGNLIPGIYLHWVAEKASAAEERHHLQSRSEELLAPLRARDGPLAPLGPEEQGVIERVAEECAQLFQRSSSCVEGRNGQLALRHHSWHRISDRKLKALTTVHNYFVKRSDGSTAAERFFNAKPRDLFEWVLERVDLPGRPAQKRAQPRPKGYLVSSAA